GWRGSQRPGPRAVDLARERGSERRRVARARPARARLHLHHRHAAQGDAADRACQQRRNHGLSNPSNKESVMSGTTSKNANKKRFGKFAASNIPERGKAVNAGPQRGDNSHPPSNKAMANN